MDQTQTIMPGSISGTHLVECPHCHAGNGITAVRCWSCDRALPPELEALSATDLASESAWPKDAFAGVNVSEPASVADTAVAASNTADFQAFPAAMDLPTTSRSERRARLGAVSAPDPSLTLPGNLFASKESPSKPIAVGDALARAGMSAEDPRVPPQESTLDEQAREAIPEWKPEPWNATPERSVQGASADRSADHHAERTVGTPPGASVPAESDATSRPSGAESPGSRRAESTSEAAADEPVEFFPQFRPVHAHVEAPGGVSVADTAGSSGAAGTTGVAGRPTGGVHGRNGRPGVALNAPATNARPPLEARNDEHPSGGRPSRRMTPEEIAATFRAPIRRHAWQDPRWLGAGAAVLALAVGLGVYFYPSTVDESDWTPASTRGLVEQRGSVRNPQAILDGEPVSPPTTPTTPTAPAIAPTRDPEAILNGAPTGAGTDTTALPTENASRPSSATPQSRAAASEAIDAVLSRPPIVATRPAPAADARAPEPSAPSEPAPPAVSATDATTMPARTPSSSQPPPFDANRPASTGGCAANVRALGLCTSP